MSDFIYLPEISKKFKNISKSTELSNNRIESISKISTILPLLSSDANLVVFGSIARGEFTKNSDIDWTVLVDGQANPTHDMICKIINKEFEKLEFIEPGNTGMFGQITFSHELIHNIGGKDDTNHNLSRRLLLLLESEKISFTSQGTQESNAYDRVINAIIQQYIENDSGLKQTKQNLLPRYLLNDIVRFWRTICVDFAYKQKEQDGRKWAIRNIKLRMSRKLIYVKGLLMCYSCYKLVNPTEEEIVADLRNNAKLKPLDIIVKVFQEDKIDEKRIIKLLNSYDNFLKLLDNRNQRKALEKLEMDDVFNNHIFLKARDNAQTFQNELLQIFMNEEGELKKFILKFGIF